MKIPANSVDSFIKTRSASLAGVLIYGADNGLVNIRADIIAKQIVDDLSDPFRVSDLTSDRIKDDPAILLDEMMSVCFGGGKRLVRIKNADKTILPAIKNAFLTPIANAFVLVTAAELPPSGLRKFFEDKENLAAIPCYQDEAWGLSSVISEAMRKHHLSFNDEVLAFLSENCRGNRMIVLTEIEKLALYMGDNKNVSIDDVRSAIGETTESSFDDICFAVAGGNQKLLEKHLRKADFQGIMPVMILRSVQRYFMRIYTISAMVTNGMSQDQAMSSLRPPVFFKQKPHIKRHLDKWKNQTSLQRAVSTLYEAEIECKKTGLDATLKCNRFLMKVAAIKC